MAELKKGSRVTGSDRDSMAVDLRKRYEAGESIRLLAESTGRSYGFVHRILSESGTSLRGRGGATRGSAKTGTAVAEPKAKAPKAKKADKDKDKASKKKKS